MVRHQATREPIEECEMPDQPPLIQVLMPRTVWIVRSAVSGFDAVDHEGRTVGHNLYKSTLEYQLRKAASEKDSRIYAIATVVNPGDRIPNRRPNQRKTTR